MAALTLLSKHLAKLCRHYCPRCAPSRPSEPPPAFAAPHRAMNHPERRASQPRPECLRCQFILLLDAIDNLVPGDEVADWLAQPNGDLDGRTPGECIDARDYDPLFRALFLIERSEPAVAS